MSMSNQQRPLRDVQKTIYITDDLEQKIMNAQYQDGFTISENAVIVKALEDYFGNKPSPDEQFQIMFSEHDQSIVTYPCYIQAKDKSTAVEIFRSEHPDAIIHEVY